VVLTVPGEIRPDRPGRRGTGGGDVDTKKNEGPRGNQNPSVSSSSLKYAATQSFSQPRSASTSFWPRFRRRCRRSPLRRLRRRLRRLRPLLPWTDLLLPLGRARRRENCEDRPSLAELDGETDSKAQGQSCVEGAVDGREIKRQPRETELLRRRFDKEKAVHEAA
jgi:hypothetical protein